MEVSEAQRRRGSTRHSLPGAVDVSTSVTVVPGSVSVDVSVWVSCSIEVVVTVEPGAEETEVNVMSMVEVM